MQTQYDYAKDNRTDDKYFSDVAIGQHNQQLAIDQFLVDYFIENNKLLECQHNKDKDFQTNGGNWEYNADYIIIGDNITPVEVKVQLAPLTDTIDIKASQVRKLGDNGIFLYALPKQYAIIKAKTILSEGCIIKSKRFLNKPVYQLQTDKINWIYWLHKPKFISYERTK